MEEVRRPAPSSTASLTFSEFPTGMLDDAQYATTRVFERGQISRDVRRMSRHRSRHAQHSDKVRYGATQTVSWKSTWFASASEKRSVISLFDDRVEEN
jgi:hypothetical protein